MCKKQFDGIKIIRNSNLPVELWNEELNEMEVFHMISSKDTLYVSEELFSALNRRYRSVLDD